MDIIKQRAKAIRQGTPDCAQKLFAAQNKICDLCGRPIQDLILADLDHVIPVIKYAQCLDVAIEDAVRECNHFENLKVVHTKCNQIKSGRTREEWIELGLDKKVSEPKFLAESQLARLKFWKGIGGRIGGKTSGHNHLKNGTGIFGLTKEQKSEVGRKNGQRNIKNGHMSAIGLAHGPIQGKLNVESGQVLTLPHFRWHVRRGLKKSNCPFCKAD